MDDARRGDTGESPVPDFAGMPLARIRAAVDALGSEDQAMRWARALQADSRAGARALGGRVERRVGAQRADRLRVAGLFEIRAGLMSADCCWIAGVDEVGVGPLAGPVVAAAVILPESVILPGLDDSKKISKEARKRLDRAIREQAVGFAIGEVSAVEIDRINIYRAGLEAMRRAAAALLKKTRIDHLLVDARTIPDLSLPQTALIHGDSRDGSIAAASIVAKVYRDGLMEKLETEYPGYGLVRNMGYGTAEHMGALRRLGASPAHRQSFAPVAAALGR
ncbi:MAG: ribonuclease HII [Myxococcota bacterium]|nr:ribonuclease HII [Myxococcota bacterium]